MDNLMVGRRVNDNFGNFDDMLYDLRKVDKVIKSCVTIEQKAIAKKYLDLFCSKWNDYSYYEFFKYYSSYFKNINMND